MKFVKIIYYSQFNEALLDIPLFPALKNFLVDSKGDPYENIRDFSKPP